MKKLTLTLFCLLLFAFSLKAQSYFYNSTLGTTGVRITALESTNYSTTLNPLVGKQYITISGYATGDVTFSIGDSLFTDKTSISVASGKAILLYNVWLPKYGSAMIWVKSASGTIDLDLQYRVF